MRQRIVLLSYFGIAALLASCSGRALPEPTSENIGHTSTPSVAVPSVTPLPSFPSTSALTSPSSTPKALPLTTASLTVVATATPIISSSAQLKSQCLEVAPNPLPAVTSRGLVLLESQVVDALGNRELGNYLLNMTTGHNTLIPTAQHETQSGFAVSPNRKFMAYDSILWDATQKDVMISEKLVLASTDGRQLKTFPWEKDWTNFIGWLDNQHWLIHLSVLDPVTQRTTRLVLNPFTGERQILGPNFSQFVVGPYVKLPYWAGWYGVIYDPALTRAIYPRLVGPDNKRYTYAIWDLPTHQLVATLETIFAVPPAMNLYPMPRWSPDGSQFVFRGAMDVSTDPTKPAPEFELFRVSRDGQTEQWTHLASTAIVQDSNLSWSPDGQHIAMFLDNVAVDDGKARVAVLNTTNLELTDYCMSATYAGAGYGGSQPPPAVWSPDGTQFLVVDWDKQDHRRVILVDIVRNVAVQIAENMEPVGWMISEP